MKFVLMTVGVVFIGILAVMFLPGPTGWLVNNGSLTMRVHTHAGEVWSVEGVKIDYVVSTAHGNACSSPYKGQVVLISEPIVFGQGERVAVVAVREQSGGYQLDYGGWIESFDGLSSASVLSMIKGEMSTQETWNAALVLGLRVDQRMGSPIRSSNFWAASGTVAGGGPSASDLAKGMFLEGGGFSSARLRAKALGLGEVRVGMNIRWQALRSEPLLGLVDLFC